MYLDEFQYARWGGPDRPSCRACKQPILERERSRSITFDNDRNGRKGLTGEYHLSCSRPFDSLARAINMMSRFGR